MSTCSSTVCGGGQLGARAGRRRPRRTTPPAARRSSTVVRSVAGADAGDRGARARGAWRRPPPAAPASSKRSPTARVGAVRRPRPARSVRRLDADDDAVGAHHRLAAAPPPPRPRRPVRRCAPRPSPGQCRCDLRFRHRREAPRARPSARPSSRSSERVAPAQPGLGEHRQHAAAGRAGRCPRRRSWSTSSSGVRVAPQDGGHEQDRTADPAQPAEPAAALVAPHGDAAGDDPRIDPGRRHGGHRYGDRRRSEGRGRRGRGPRTWAWAPTAGWAAQPSTLDL